MWRSGPSLNNTVNPTNGAGPDSGHKAEPMRFTRPRDRSREVHRCTRPLNRPQTAPCGTGIVILWTGNIMSQNDLIIG